MSFEDNPGDLPEDAIKGDDGEELEKIKNPEIQQKTQQEKVSEDGAANSNEEKSNGDAKSKEEKSLDENHLKAKKRKKFELFLDY